MPSSKKLRLVAPAPLQRLLAAFAKSWMQATAANPDPFPRVELATASYALRSCSVLWTHLAIHDVGINSFARESRSQFVLGRLSDCGHPRDCLLDSKFMNTCSRLERILSLVKKCAPARMQAPFCKSCEGGPRHVFNFSFGFSQAFRVRPLARTALKPRDTS